MRWALRVTVDGVHFWGDDRLQGAARAIVHRRSLSGRWNLRFCVQPIGVNGIPRREWTALAAALGL